MPHYPQVPGFKYPVIVGLVELEEGPRLVSNIVGVDRDQLEIGMPLEVTWLDTHPALVEGATDSRGPITIPQFRPAAPARRETTRAADSVSVGDKLRRLGQGHHRRPWSSAAPSRPATSRTSTTTAISLTPADRPTSS